MYLGQLIEIRNLLRQLGLGSVRVSTVDNYQGEENDIILLSLVRSNEFDKIGFLKINNRVCVALSRAKMGFYCIGNFDLMVKNSKKWENIIESVKQNSCYGNTLKLTCGLHTKNDVDVIQGSDFDARPDGGCNLKCNFRLKCGHVCPLFCHTFDLEHKDFECMKKCDKMIEKCGHYCQTKCSHDGDCNQCFVKVEKIIQQCGHKILFRCDTEPLKSDCYEPCENTLKCGHKCIKLCGSERCEPCKTLVNVPSTCEHKSSLRVYCHEPSYTYAEKCHLKCNKELPCEHLCQSECGKCYSGRIHSSCTQECNRILYCGHKCTDPCAKQCQGCRRDCENSCVHSKCGLACSYPCAPCLEKCAWRCKHFKCTKLCHELCDRGPCNRPCNSRLNCGHKCVGFCGEPCPSLCRFCDREELTEIFFGTEEERKARFVLLEDCGHVVESSGMDSWIEHVRDSNVVQLPECPKCKTPIRRNFRYANFVKEQLKSIEGIKLKNFGDPSKIEREKRSLRGEIKFSGILREMYNYNNRRSEYASNEWFLDKICYKLEEMISYNEIVSLKNTFNLIKRLMVIKKSITKFMYNSEFALDHLNYEVNKMKSFLFDSYFNRIVFNSSERMTDLFAEVERIEYLVVYYRYKLKFEIEPSSYPSSKSDEIRSLLERCNYILMGSIKIETNELKSCFSELNKHIYFELSKEVKTEIVKAIGLKKGHWFKCKNGHCYCIGECGGAMETAKCPECDSVIGGERHNLVAGNSFAPEMDGAEYPVYSELNNNMDNWNLDD